MSRCALVTGASRGLGRCVAVELAARKYDLIGLGCRNAKGVGAALPEEIAARGARAIPLCADLQDPQAPAKIVSEFLEHSGGRLDLLVNNAGCFKGSPVVRLDVAEWERQVEVNLSAPFRLMRAAAGALAASGGCVVNVSSVCGFSGAAGAAAYSAAKAGLEALTRCAALEWGGQGVRVNAVIPGFMLETDMGQASTPDYVEQVLSLSPLGRPAQARAAARLIADLADFEAVSGQVLSLEGRVGRQAGGRFGPE